MDALDLDVDQGICVHVDVQLLLQHHGKLRLASRLHLHPRLLQGGVVLLLDDLLQLGHVSEPGVVAELLSEDGAECWVGAVHPTAGSDAVGHVDDCVWGTIVAAILVELWEGFLLDDLSVDSCNAIDLAGSHAGEAAHTDLLDITLLEDAQVCDHRSVTILLPQGLAPAAVELANDLHMAWQEPLHHLHGPLLQRLRHDGVVGVVAALGGEVPCLFPTQVLDVHEQAHHLRHSNGRVRVVHLDGDLLRQLGPLVVGPLDELAEHVLERGADEEVLLLQAELLALVGGIIGVQDRGEVFSTTALVNSIGILGRTVGVEVELLRGRGLPQAQVVGVVGVEARDGVVVGHGLHDLTANPSQAPVAILIDALRGVAVEAHRVGHVRPGNLEGAAVAQPIVRALHLSAILDVLLEHSIAVPDAVAPAREGECCHGVQEARGQSAEAAVPERGIILLLVEFLELHAQTIHRLRKVLLQVQVCDGILHVAANEVLRRQVVRPLHILLAVEAIGVIQ
mmetsp:Transcript_56733/g.135121  ORF Transcript_56733/g.135121 Transcript_56733/m.135121 type:complete len:509 (-) Transcript_56733:400-1926(-)